MLSSSSLAPPVARGVRASRSCRAVVISRTSSSSRALADFLYCVRRNDRARSDDAARVAPTCLGTCSAPVAKPAEVAVEAMVLCVGEGWCWWVGGYVGRYVSKVGFFLLENKRLRPLVLELCVVDVSSLGVERGRVEVDEKLKTVGVRAKPERSNDGRVNSGDSITFWPFNPPHVS